MHVRVFGSHQILGILSGGPRDGDALPFVTVLAKWLVPAVLGRLVHIPWADQRGIPIGKVWVVRLRVVGVVLRASHSHAIEGAPQCGSIAILVAYAR